MERIERLQLWFNGILMLCGIAGGGLSYYQLEAVKKANEVATDAATAAKKSNEIASETARMQLSAYLVLSDEKPVMLFDEKDGRLAAQLKFKNVGQTPAYVTQSEWQIHLHQPAKSQQGDRTYLGTIGPGREITVNIHGSLSGESLKAMLADDTHLLLLQINLRFSHAFDYDPSKGENNPVIPAFFIFQKSAVSVPGQPLIFELGPGPAGEGTLIAQ
jgi:hypothetical protein